MNSWFFEQARKGNLYHSDNTTGKAHTAIHATHTGVALENPLGSGKDLVIESFSFTGSTLTTISELGIGIAPSSSSVLSGSTTANVIHNAQTAGGGVDIGVALPYSVATLSSTPVWLMPLGSSRITNAVEGGIESTKVFDGTLIVAPGMYACIMALTTARTGLGSVTWAEIDILPEGDIPLL